MSATAPYRVVVLGADATWVREVAQRALRGCAEVIERPGAVVVETRLSPAGDPAEAPPQSLVVFLADERSREDADLVAQLRDGRDQLLPVLPVVRPDADVFGVLPDVLRPLNAMPWETDGSNAIRAVLRLLGLTEAERRVFLSYRRQETSSLALQLREHLSRRSFDVFLDRFSVPPAADFQRRIDIELADKAFVLLLESPAALGSPWVQHEVAYALSHGIALLALSLPETTKAARFESVDEAFRLRLHPRHLHSPSEPIGADERVLTEDGLAVVLEEVEDRYARQLRRRRTALLGSLQKWLTDARGDPQLVADEWALAAACPNARPRVFLITPRAPTPAGLRQLDWLRIAHEELLGEQVDGCLVFGAAAQDPDDKQLIDWITSGRRLTTRSHIAVPAMLGLP